MRLSLAIVSAIVLLNVATLSALAAEVGADESRAGVCGDFDGVAFTFCVALCEARECDRQPSDDARCALLRHGFARVTGGALAPCDGGQAAARNLAL
jgi:hypothetical protein